MSNLGDYVNIRIPRNNARKTGFSEECRSYSTTNQKWETDANLEYVETLSTTSYITCRTKHFTDFSVAEISVTGATNNGTTTIIKEGSSDD